MLLVLLVLELSLTCGFTSDVFWFASLPSIVCWVCLFSFPLVRHSRALVRLRRVKLGMHEDTGVRYAVKVMAKRRISTPSLTMQVRREVAVMKAAPHSR